MRFESIEIINYRQYIHYKLLFNNNLDTDLHVIIAPNATGKTNILNSINWCLYGDEPHLGDASEALSICNVQACNEAKQKGQDNCTVRITITANVDNSTIILSREANIRAESGFVLSEKFKVTIIDKSGNSEILENVAANELVNKYLPMKIREYFFFDGEQLHNYFGPKSSSMHVKDSINEIAQVNILKSVKNHLSTFIKDYQKILSKTNPKIDEIAAGQEKCNIDIENVKREIDDLNESINVSKEIINENESNIAGTETAVADNNTLHKNENKLTELTNEKKSLVNKIKKLIQKYSILLYMYDINKNTYHYINEKYKKGVLPPDIDIKLLDKSLHDNHCAVCNQLISNEAQAYINSLIKKIEVGSDVSHKLTEIKNDVFSSLEESRKYRKEKNDLIERLRKIDTEINELEDENVELKKNIIKYSSIDDIEMWIQQRDENKDLVEKNVEKLGSCKERYENLLKLSRKLDSDMKLALEEVEKSDEIQKYLKFCSEAYGILNETEQEIVDEVRIEMETLTFKIFERLNWRASEYGRLELDSYYKLRLFHKITNTSCLGSCSAAERELMALAFTIALHQVSGHNCLLFIDSPVGRVSDINRTNFAKSLIKTSEFKQIILAFTPSEYSKEISDLFNSSVVSSKRELITESTHYEEV